ncbi:MAG: hypothetical protein ACR2PL_27820 [Dehalococcoidia bacterium]
MNAGGFYPSEQPHAAFFRDNPIDLQGEPRLALSVVHRYRTVEEASPRRQWSVQTAGYYDDLRFVGGPELVAYHWHPDPPNIITTPHLHLSGGARVGFAPLAAAHVPTGQIGLDDLLRLAIRDLGVRPLRSDWLAILDRVRASLVEENGTRR